MGVGRLGAPGDMPEPGAASVAGGLNYHPVAAPSGDLQAPPTPDARWVVEGSPTGQQTPPLSVEP